MWGTYVCEYEMLNVALAPTDLQKDKAGNLLLLVVIVEWDNISLNQVQNKSEIKRRIALGCLDPYTCRGLRLWNSQDREAV